MSESASALRERRMPAVVAVNSDDEAPIFALADLGVVGDLHAVLDGVVTGLAEREG